MYIYLYIYIAFMVTFRIIKFTTHTPSITPTSIVKIELILTFFSRNLKKKINLAQKYYYLAKRNSYFKLYRQIRDTKQYLNTC